MMRLLHTNPNAKPGSWGKAECADALMQIASSVEMLAKQLDRLWSLAAPSLQREFDAGIAEPFEQVYLALARKIEAYAVSLQQQADAEAA